jgi:hypothetical protein
MGIHPGREEGIVVGAVKGPHPSRKLRPHLFGQPETEPRSDVVVGKPLIPWAIQSFLFDRETLSFYRKRNLQYALSDLPRIST